MLHLIATTTIIATGSLALAAMAYDLAAAWPRIKSALRKEQAP